MPAPSCYFYRVVRLAVIITTLPLAALTQMTTSVTPSSALRIPGASITITAPILSAAGYVGLVHPTKVLADGAPWTTRGECEYGYRLMCTNSHLCEVGDHKTAWQGPTRYEGLGITSGAAYTEFCELHGMTSADCVRVTTPVHSYWSGSSSPYIATTTTFTLSASTGIGFAQVPVTGVGYGSGGRLNGHEFFIEHYKSCLEVYVQPTAVPVAPKQTSTAAQKSGGLSQDAKVGIGAGIGAAVVCIVVLVFVYRAAQRCQAADGKQRH